MEFVGIDVSQDGNRPTMSKHRLLQTWPSPITIHDIASLIGLANFYPNFIPHFEVRTKRLHEIIKLVYLEPLAPQSDNAAKTEWEDIKDAMLSDYCIMRFDHRKCQYLCTDFSSIRFGYTATQPGYDKEFPAAMHHEITEGLCEFMVKGSKLTLHPVTFGTRRTHDNETQLHSKLGEGYTNDWLIDKCCHLCWDMQFT